MDRDRRTQVPDRVREVVGLCLARDTEMSLAPRVVLAVRQEWFGSALRAALIQRGVEVPDVIVDGADAVGLAIAKQPDLVLIEAVTKRVAGAVGEGSVCVAEVHTATCSGEPQNVKSSQPPDPGNGHRNKITLVADACDLQR